MTAVTEAEVVAGDLTVRLASFVSAIDADDLPEAAVERLKQCLLDFVGLTAFAGARSESSEAIRGGVASLSAGHGTGTVVGDARGYAYPYAALLNGAFAHSLDFDDTNIYGSLHPGAPVIPAALAVAERTGATGRELLAALAAGYETCCRVGAALGQTSYDRGFHITPVAGIFGAIAAGARLLAFSPDQLANAWGLGGSMASGSMQYLANGAWNKRLHPGLAAHDALLCLSFTESGVIAAAQPFEGRFGLLAGYSNAPAPQLLVQELGERWVLTETAIKPYPSCRLTHGAVDIALQLRERLGGPPRPEGHLGLRISPRAYQIVGGMEPNKTAPVNVVDAQFSVYFQTAVALLDGTVDWSSYDRLADPDVRGLAGRLQLVADEAVPTAGAVLTYESSDGEPLTIRTDRPMGEPGDDLPWPVVERKFRDLAGAVFGAEQRDRIVADVRAMGAVESAADWIRTLRPPAEAGGPS